MKTIAVVFAVCIVGALGTLTEEHKAKLREHRDKCIDETKVDRTLVDKAHGGQWQEGDEKLQCFAACLLKKLGMMAEDGKLNEEVSLAKMTLDVGAEKAREIWDNCKDKTGANTCAKGFELMKCYTSKKTLLLA
uniref:Odorant binding protein n=1 Tax=Meteorus pulchricornis TaxID=51522 RepID=A0A1S5VFH1_9HYME